MRSLSCVDLDTVTTLARLRIKFDCCFPAPPVFSLLRLTGINAIHASSSIGDEHINDPSEGRSLLLSRSPHHPPFSGHTTLQTPKTNDEQDVRLHINNRPERPRLLPRASEAIETSSRPPRSGSISFIRPPYLSRRRRIMANPPLRLPRHAASLRKRSRSGLAILQLPSTHGALRPA